MRHPIPKSSPLPRGEVTRTKDMNVKGEFPEKRFPGPERREEIDFSSWIEHAGRMEIAVKGDRYWAAAASGSRKARAA